MIHIRTLPGRFQALGEALHYLSRRPPFSDFKATELVRTIDAQLERRHYRFAVEGTTVVGYLGWALYDLQDAVAFTRTGQPPDNSRANGRDVVWILTAATSGSGALLALIEDLRSQHAGKRVMGVRHRRPGRRVVFDRVLQPR
jgi:hemolysin-activating ACP:hemolysin acyltransferase